MPEVSRFYGVINRIFHNDHPPPHFHAVYGEFEALIEIETLQILRSELPRRALALVLEWAAVRREPLRQAWGLARRGRVLLSIAPLD